MIQRAPFRFIFLAILVISCGKEKVPIKEIPPFEIDKVEWVVYSDPPGSAGHLRAYVLFKTIRRDFGSLSDFEVCTNEVSTGKKYCFRPYVSDFSYIGTYLDNANFTLSSDMTYSVMGKYKYQNQLENGSLGDIISYVTDSLILVPLQLPSVEIGSITNINSFYAVAKGKLKGGLLKSLALCWNTTGNPTMADDHFNILAKEGDFSGYIGHLLPQTHYFIRAYTENAKGSFYGSQLEFVTAPVLFEKGVLTDSRDGQTYKTIKYGDQWWMAKGLVTKMIAVRMVPMANLLRYSVLRPRLN